MLGDRFTAAEAKEHGIINDVVEDALSTAMKSSARIAAKRKNALRVSKRPLRRGPVSLSNTLLEEMAQIADRLELPEFHEAATAFSARRAPDLSKFQ